MLVICFPAIILVLLIIVLVETETGGDLSESAGVNFGFGWVVWATSGATNALGLLTRGGVTGVVLEAFLAGILDSDFLKDCLLRLHDGIDKYETRRRGNLGDTLNIIPSILSCSHGVL
ncbi:hypothetical protein B0H13DRAFT_2384019 [Mycena leptocephala]|nr:hypothetical protein B0H13DRAFT_2384019 [Mycena leptocephala]